MRTKVVVVVLLMVSFATWQLQSAEAKLLPADAEAAWKEVENASKAPPPPPEWGGKPPTAEQKKAFYKVVTEKMDAVAAKANEFYARFPDHPKAAEAKQREERFKELAVQLRGSLAEEATITPEEAKFREQVSALHQRAMQKRDPQKPRNGISDVTKEMENGLRDLMKEYPDRPELWQQMFMVAENTPDKEEQKRLLTEIVNAKAADENTITRAKAAIRAVGALGHPLEMSFTASDGRKVDVQKMKGKVVLIDYWASWCGPCMASLPEVIALYKKYHPKGFEIIGINMDKQQNLMEQVLKQFEIPWPQYFDGKGWGTKYALDYNVTAIPSVWLVDKKGVLRTLNARENLEMQVTELLAEEL